MNNLQISWIFEQLYGAYGPQGWWPAETPLEVIIGAVLTQNTAWQNVERAIENLKKAGLLHLQGLVEVENKTLAELIRPSGYFNVKARRLKGVVMFLHEAGGVETLISWDKEKLRAALLRIKGVGEETADSILLYAFEKPVFVVDSYTKRVFSRLGLIEDEGVGYESLQTFFECNLFEDVKLFNEFHALIVKLGKERCKKRQPLCVGCPLGVKCLSNDNL
jgi:endonuclease-3 related protein